MLIYVLGTALAVIGVYAAFMTAVCAYLTRELRDTSAQNDALRLKLRDLRPLP